MAFLSFLKGFIPTAHAGLIEDTLGMVGANVPNSSDFCFGTGCFEEIAKTIIADVSPIVLIIGTIFVMVAGIKLLTSDSEDEMTNARKTIGVVAAGIVLTVLAVNGKLLSAVTNIEGGEGAMELCTEALGIVSVFEGVIGVIAIIAIAVTGIKVLASFGGEDAAGPMRNAIGAFIAGALILISKGVIFPAIGLSTSACKLAGGANSQPIVYRLLSILRELLGYLQIAAILILVILGLMLVAYMGNEDQFGKLKGYLYRLAFGIIVLSLINVIIDIVILNG